MKSKTHDCPYKAGLRDICVHKFGAQTSSTRRKCGFPNPVNCPLFLEWIEIRAQEEEKLKIDHLNSELEVSHK